MATLHPHKTASTHRSVISRGAHQLDIVGYSTWRKLGADNTVRSRSFDVGSFAWALVCRFTGNPTPARGVTLASIALELSTNETDEAVVAAASIKIDDPTGSGRWPAAEWRSAKAHTFSARSTSAVAWELAVPDAFVEHEERYVMADCLTVHCAVEVLLEESTDGATRNYSVVVPPPSSLSHDIRRLREEMWWPDVTFAVDGAKIQAHKVVLAARSPVFAAEFFRADMKEKTMRHLKINDMSASTFHAMLHFIYIDEPPEPEEGACRVAMARDLLVAAELYDLERLRLMCENILAESIAVGNVMATLMVVHGRHSCQQLESSCVEFMASDPDIYDAVQASDEYKELDKTCPSFINEITKKIATRAVARYKSPPTSSTDGGIGTKDSASRYNPSAVMVGTHEFTIENFSAIRKMHGVGQHIQSGSFQVGGYEWTMHVYPSGVTEDTAEYIGVFVKAMIDDINRKVKASVAVKPLDLNSKSSLSGHNFTCMYAGKERNTWGWSKFITSELANSHYMAYDGSFTMQCRVEVTTKSCASNPIVSGADVVTPIHVPSSNLAQHLERLLTSEEGWDVKFRVEDNEIHAHRIVIATRSPVLHGEVESATDTCHVNVNAMTAVAFKAMLHFIYTDELPHINDLAHSLMSAGDPTTVIAGEMLAAACRFRLRRMKLLCENLLADKITPMNALATLKLAGRHGCTELEGYCIEYISLPHVVKDVMKTLSRGAFRHRWKQPRKSESMKRKRKCRLG